MKYTVSWDENGYPHSTTVEADNIKFDEKIVVFTKSVPETQSTTGEFTGFTGKQPVLVVNLSRFIAAEEAIEGEEK